DVRLLESMAGTAAVSIINARLYDQSQRRVTELATLLDASEAASSTLELATVLEHVVRGLTGNLGVAQSIIMAWNAPRQQLMALAEVSNTYWSDGGPLRELVPGSPVQTALLTGQAQYESTRNRELSRAQRQQFETAGISSLLAVPIRRRGSVIGLASLASMIPHGLNETDAAAAESLLKQWLASLPPDIPLNAVSHQRLTDLTTDLLNIADTCWVTIHSWSPGNTFTRPVREIGFVERTQRPGPGLTISDYPTMQQVIETKGVRHLTLTGLSTDTPEHDWLTSRGGRSALLVPLILHGVAIGMVVLIDTAERIFDHEETRLAQGIANVVSNAMEN